MNFSKEVHASEFLEFLYSIQVLILLVIALAWGAHVKIKVVREG